MSCNPRCTYGQYDPCINVETELAKKIETVKVGNVTASQADGVVTITKEDIESLGISAGGYSVFSIGTIGVISSENPITETKADGTTATYTDTASFYDRLSELVSDGIPAFWATATSASILYYTLNYRRTGLIAGQTVARFGFAYATDSRIYAFNIEVQYDTDQVIRRTMNVEPSSGGVVYLTHSLNDPDLEVESIVSSDGTTIATAESLYNYVENCKTEGIGVIFIDPNGDENYYCPLSRANVDTENEYYEITLSCVVYSQVRRIEISGDANGNSIYRNFTTFVTSAPTYRMCHTDTLGAISAANPIYSTNGYWKDAGTFITDVYTTIDDDDQDIWKWRYANRVYDLAYADGTSVIFTSDDGTTKSVLTVDANGVSVSNI